jgi:DNA-binding transcriptional LysR family regulator
MNLAAIETFLEVVRAGNLNRAAERLNVTQSTVTARLDALEAAVGQTLLSRSRQGTVMTKAGFAFQRHAETMIGSWELARRSLGVPRGYTELFSIGCDPALWEGLGDVWFARIGDLFESTALEAWPGESENIRRWLGASLVDAALTLEPVAGHGIRSEPALSERIELVTSGDPANWREGYVQIDHGSEFRRWHARQPDVDAGAAFGFGTLDWALAHLRRRGGSAFLPGRVAGGFARVAGAPVFERTIYLAHREDEARATALRAALAAGSPLAR